MQIRNMQIFCIEDYIQLRLVITKKYECSANVFNVFERSLFEIFHFIFQEDTLQQRIAPILFYSFDQSVHQPICCYFSRAPWKESIIISDYFKVCLPA